jgi:predicted nuclease of predicted toxin-antitoxin system
MKGFLLDENLPSRLNFAPSLPVTHAKTLGAQPTDSELWNFAKQNDLAIVSKDADFSDRMMLATPPPRVVHLAFGNMRRNAYHAHLALAWPKIETLIKNHKLVRVFLDRIEGVS